MNSVTGVDAAPEISPVIREYLEGELRAKLTEADNIAKLLGRKRKTVTCHNCGHTFDAKREQYGEHR